MTIDLDATKLHDFAHEEFQAFAGGIQGNILVSHGRNFGRYLFCTFLDIDAIAARKALSRLGALVTSAMAQRRQTEVFNATHRSQLFCALLVSASGYERLELQARGLVDAKFASAPTLAGEDGEVQAIDFLVLLGDDTEASLDGAEAEIRGTLEGVARVAKRERGAVIRDDDERRIEHFGYVDGISEPAYVRAGSTSARAWEATEPLSRVLVADPWMPARIGAYGTYFAFMKLEQDVNGFRDAVGELARKLDTKKPDANLAGAMVVGRFRDGTPLFTSDAPRNAAEPDNDFVFHGEGINRCPVHAHIRAMNPRRDRDIDAVERPRRITRRAIPYADSDGEVGLLFGSFQASIEHQFVFMLRQWANAPMAVDPLIGAQAGAQRWPTMWGGNATVQHDFRGFVTAKWGVYLFAPSMAFFRQLADAPPPNAL